MVRGEGRRAGRRGPPGAGRRAERGGGVVGVPPPTAPRGAEARPRRRVRPLDDSLARLARKVRSAKTPTTAKAASTCAPLQNQLMWRQAVGSVRHSTTVSVSSATERRDAPVAATPMMPQTRRASRRALPSASPQRLA